MNLKFLQIDKGQKFKDVYQHLHPQEGNLRAYQNTIMFWVNKKLTREEKQNVKGERMNW